MKKIISLMLISIVIITISTTAFAINPSLPSNNGNNGENNASLIPGSEYDKAQNNTVDNTIGNNKVNNTTTSLPQTGIEDYNVGILLVICIASAVYAYKKVSDYRNI